MLTEERQHIIAHCPACGGTHIYFEAIVMAEQDSEGNITICELDPEAIDYELRNVNQTVTCANQQCGKAYEITETGDMLEHPSDPESLKEAYADYLQRRRVYISESNRKAEEEGFNLVEESDFPEMEYDQWFMSLQYSPYVGRYGDLVDIYGRLISDIYR